MRNWVDVRVFEGVVRGCGLKGGGERGDCGGGGVRGGGEGVHSTNAAMASQ